MPMDYKRYPENWKAISLAVKQRAGNKCEICGAANGSYIARSVVNPACYIIYNAEQEGYYTTDGVPLQFQDMPDEFADSRTIKVILTTHHVGIAYSDGTPGDPHDKMDCRPENLQALCQRCHLMADQSFRVARAKLARAAKQKAIKAIVPDMPSMTLLDQFIEAIKG